ncbi:MAG: hypothetical protein ABIO82_04340 [Ginsengibacter sp.]
MGIFIFMIFVGIMIAGVLVYFYFRRKQLREKENLDDGIVTAFATSLKESQ